MRGDLLAGELAEGAEDTNPEQRRMRVPRRRKSLPIDSIQVVSKLEKKKKQRP